MEPMRAIKSISFPDKHSAAFGTTQSGKTFGVQKSLLRAPEGVLFFNTNHAELKGYIKATKSIELSDLIAAIRAGEKINYMPSREYRWREIAAITNGILDNRKLNVRIVFDECHLITLNSNKEKRKAQEAMEEVATTGLSRGMKAVFITQRPALLINTLMTQAEYKIFYRTENEGPYLKSYGVPYDEIEKRIDDGGEYAYCTYYRKEIEGAYKV
jgi:hypothetical protein